MGRGNGASSPPSLFCVQVLVCFRKQFFNTLTVAPADGYADARGERRLFIIVGENFADAIRDTACFVFLRFRENQGEFVPAVSRGGIDGAAVNTENIGKAADGAAADEMAVAIVDFFQFIEVEKEHGERSAGAVGTLRFTFQDVEQVPVVSKAGER